MLNFLGNLFSYFPVNCYLNFSKYNYLKCDYKMLLYDGCKGAVLVLPLPYNLQYSVVTVHKINHTSTELR
jgi:hypothetical protein